jgi:hypothetical protein
MKHDIGGTLKITLEQEADADNVRRTADPKTSRSRCYSLRGGWVGYNGRYRYRKQEVYKEDDVRKSIARDSTSRSIASTTFTLVPKQSIASSFVGIFFPDHSSRCAVFF